LAVDRSGNLFAGGSSVAKWNGTTWSVLGSVMYTAALATDGSGNLYAGGSFTTAGGVSANYIAKWNGTTWSALGSGMNGAVVALAVDGNGNLYAGGSFTAAGGVPVSGIAEWNGTTWSALGSGMSGGDGYGSRVESLIIDGNGNLYAGGSFTAAGGVPASRIAKWDGTTWSALGSGMNGTVASLAVDGSGNLYAGGNFTTSGGVSANEIAKWNGTAWSALGSGMNGVVLALAIDDSGSKLYAGGDFTSAGAKLSGYFGMWYAPTPSPVPSDSWSQPAVMLGDATPNPFNPSTTLHYSLPVSGRVRLAIYDLRGRLIRTLVDEDLPGGDHQTTWDGKDERGSAVASGTYCARIDAGAMHETKRLTLIK
jgi:hypothetical protein